MTSKAIALFSTLTSSAIILNTILGFFPFREVEMLPQVLYFIMPGAVIEDNAVVAATGVLITKIPIFKKNEVWTGIPTKRIKLGQEEIIPSVASYITIKEI